MKPKIWFLMVIIALGLLIATFITKNIYIAVGTFLLVRYLNKYIDTIPLPKQFSKYKVISQKTKPS